MSGLGDILDDMRARDFGDMVNASKKQEELPALILVMYHEEQDAFRFYLTKEQRWEDMYWTSDTTSLAMLVGYGWELVGEL